MSFSAGLQRKRTHVPIRFGRSLLMVRPLRAGTSSASPQAVERPVKGFTQPVHRNVWTPLENRGKIVDMTRGRRPLCNGGGTCVSLESDRLDAIALAAGARSRA